MSERTQDLTLMFLLCVTSFVLGAVVAMLFLVPILRQDEVAAYDYRIELPIQLVLAQGGGWEEDNSSRLVEIGDEGGVIVNPRIYGRRIVSAEGMDLLLVRYPVKRRRP